MADNPAPTNAVRPRDVARSTKIGDVPDALRRRFLTESGRFGGGLAYYVDATTLVPSFRDRGGELLATRSDPATVRDLLSIAEHRGWRSLRVQGADGFRREVWLAAKTAGLDVEGFRPSERDEQALARRLEARQRHEGLDAAIAQRETRGTRRDDLARPSQRLRIAEAIVRDRVSDPSAQARLLAAARARLASLLERQNQSHPTERRRAAAERRR